MSTLFQPYGFSQVAKIGGKFRANVQKGFLTASTDGLTTYATSLAAGDPVRIGANGFIIQGVVGGNTNTYPSTTSIAGQFVDVIYTDPNQNIVRSTLWTANTPVAAGTVPQVTYTLDPTIVFQVQCNGQLAGLAANNTAIGWNIDFAISAPNVSTKSSTFSLDTGAASNNSSRNCKIVGLANIPNNSWYDAFPEVLVVWNNHTLHPGTLGSN